MDSQLSLKPCTEQCRRDRLSSLPNELLIRILELIPTKSAVVVCLLLNKRVIIPWITNLDFDASPIRHCLLRPNQIEHFPCFLTFVDSVLQAHKSSTLTCFRLNVGVYYYMTCVESSNYFFKVGCNQGCLPDLKSTQINAWITFPLTRCGLRELDLRIHLRGPPSQSQLPPQVFMKETLEVLKLDVNLSFDGISTFCLPNLKTLHLHASLISEDAFLTRLVSSCPSLEELIVVAWWKHVHFTQISSPSLRTLCLSIRKLEDEDNSDLVVLDTPNLEYLLYVDNIPLQYSISSMTRLVRAAIDITYGLSGEPAEVYYHEFLILIRALPNVRHLCLSGLCPLILDCVEKEKQLPEFRDLIHLELRNPDKVWSKVLAAFLYRSPNLETLVFSLGLCNEGLFTTYEGWNELGRVSSRLTLETPWCCRFNLKRIVVYRYRGSEAELIYIKFLLKYALVLEELIVFSVVPTTLESTLQNLPRASNNCSIQLLFDAHPSFLFPIIYG